MPHTLLLADDSLTIQRVIELTFADEDVRVVAVGDGDQAIASLDRQPPDIVLADVGMPGKNGYEVAGYVKSQPHLAHIPVLLLTGAFEPIDQVRADQAGCAGVLAKPFEPQAVIRLVNELLAGARGGLSRDEFPPERLAPAEPPALGRSPAGKDKLRALAEAFTALLAAEPNTAPLPGAASPSLPAITDELVERVARRVLEKLAAPVVHEAVADLVSTIAERLVRDEIERIKGEKR